MIRKSYPINTTTMSTVNNLIDYRSDTVTQPCSEMRAVMANAVVGDDVYGEDPTVIALQEQVATLLNKEASLLVPSGTMSNLIATMAHCQRGQEIIIGDQYHIASHEAGGASVLGSIVLQQIATTAKGYISAAQVEQVIRPNDPHFAVSRLVCLENTVSGFVQPQAELDNICTLARDNKLQVHLDGARLMHAVAQSGSSAADLCAKVDSVSLCLSKGLGAPAGSVLSGSKEFIDRATRLRKMLGGGMRQAGIIAAAGIYALDNNIARLQQDHQLTRYFAKSLQQIDQVEVDLSAVETNMIFPIFSRAQGANRGQNLTSYLQAHGINIGNWLNCRLVIHLDISKQDIDLTLALINAYYTD